MLLAEAIQSLAKVEREHLRAISIWPERGGYAARFDFRMRLPVASESGIAGVELSGVAAYPQIERLLDWRVPAWEQIQTAINDPQIVAECGSANAAEWSDGAEKSAHWLVKFEGTKNPHAQALGQLGGLAGSRSRGGKGGGLRPGAGHPRSNALRCKCGAMTAKRAEARGHKCT